MAVIVTRGYRLKTMKNCSTMTIKSPQVVKHVVKGEKWACSTLKAGKNKPVYYIVKMRDFKRFCKINKEKSGILRLPIFGLTPLVISELFRSENRTVFASRL